MTTGKWRRVAAPALQRSSHSLNVVGGKAYIFGGELESRTPVDNAMHVVNLATGDYEKIEADGAPPLRVGHAAAAIGRSIFLFGGRGGPAMEPLEEQGAVYEFDTAARSWRKHTPSGAYPCARSYHCAAGTPDKIVVHAGCGSGPRLSDAWAFVPSASEWTQLPDAPRAGRGGATLCSEGGALWRFGGFNGVTELGGAIDTFSKDAWASARFGEEVGLSRDAAATLQQSKGTGPGPRSVAGMHAVGERLVVVMGEGKPSITGGHEAAGNFWDDVWTYTPSSGEWAEVAIEGEKPNARGWFASDSTADGVVVHGGLDDSNTRLSDLWVLRLE
ncbi:galactose oxidase, partial [Cutaneotrichosporon oleaginosum]